VLARSLRIPVTGRSAAGLVAVTFAVPMCRLVGLTKDPNRARRIGTVVAASDAIGVLRVLGAKTPDSQKQVAQVNVILDLILASALLLLGFRRHGTERIASVAAAASVYFGAGAWFVGAYRMQN
jgi:hypothetical protein